MVNLVNHGVSKKYSFDNGCIKRKTSLIRREVLIAVVKLISYLFQLTEFIGYLDSERLNLLQVINLGKLPFDRLNFVVNQIAINIKNVNRNIFQFWRNNGNQILVFFIWKFLNMDQLLHFALFVIHFLNRLSIFIFHANGVWAFR